ncbi:MAG: NHLP leader peptide family RiPP precursor [Gammaproteobacteria bacterium]|nr:NHLP leader peptide family RiPP precursor [Gammaproteobacteria bacterium]
MEMTPEIEEKWKQVIGKAWGDTRYKQSLIDNPNKALQDVGISIPGGVNFVVVENEADRIHLVLPAAPGGDLSVESLDRASVTDYDPGF